MTGLMQKHGIQMPERKRKYPPGWEYRKSGPDKTIERPNLGCFHCGELGHLIQFCSRKAMPATPEGRQALKEWNEYTRKCDEADEVYYVTYSEYDKLRLAPDSDDGPGYIETGRATSNEDMPNPKYKDDWATISSEEAAKDVSLQPKELQKPSLGAPPPPKRKNIGHGKSTSHFSCSSFSQSSSSSQSSTSKSSAPHLTEEEEQRRQALLKKLLTPATTPDPYLHSASATPLYKFFDKFATKPPAANPDLHLDDPAYSEDPTQTFIQNSRTPFFDDPCIPSKETEPLIPPNQEIKILQRPKPKDHACDNIHSIHSDRVLCDCGAPDHAVRSTQGMINVRPPDEGETASNASGKRMNIDAVGDAPLAENAIMENTRVIPELQQDLLSLARAEDQWQTLSILGDNRIILYTGPIQLDPAHIKAVGYREGGHYFIDREEFQKRNLYHQQCASSTMTDDPIVIDPKKKSSPATYHVSTESRDDTKRQKTHHSQYFFVNNGIYTFDKGDGKIYEQLSTAESLERPIPRPTQKKRKVERFDPMKEHEKLATLWHACYCHKSGLRRTIRFQGCLGLPKTYRELEKLKDICESCLKAKMAHCVHPPVFRRLWVLGQLIHFDLHMKPILSWNGKRYSLMVVEHLSKFNLVIHLRKKSEAGKHMLFVIRWFERRTGNKVLAIQCDSAREFVGANTEIYSYCMEEGIDVNATSRSSPQENSIAEAYNKVTHYSAEAIKWHSNNPDRFWCERERHVCLVDTLMVKLNAAITAFEMIYGYRPSIELIKVFGCHAFAFITRDARNNKMSSHMRPGIYMGVSTLINGYVLYDPVKMVFFETSTCVFDELSFGFTELIDRVTGPPKRIPGEWIEQLNKQWIQLYGNPEYTSEMHEGYALRAPEDDEEKTLVEEVVPSSPVSKSKEHPQVLTGEVIPYDATPADIIDLDEDSRPSQDSEEDVDDSKEEEIEDIPRRQDAPTSSDVPYEDLLIPESPEREEVVPHTPMKTSKRPAVPRTATPALSVSRYMTKPVSKSPKPSPSTVPHGSFKGRELVFSDKPSSETATPAPIPPRRSARLAPPGKQLYYGKEAQFMLDSHKATHLNKHQRDVINVLNFHRLREDIFTVQEDMMFYLLVDDMCSAKLKDPKGFKSATSGPYSVQWWEAMIREIDAHIRNATWIMKNRPPRFQDGKEHIILRSVWKYKIKSQHGMVTSFKARLCVDGSPIIALLRERYAGTPLAETLMMIFALAAHHDITVVSGDVPSAYVQAPMPDGDKLFYITQPQGFEDKNRKDAVLLLLKCLYGLPHSGRQWNKELADFFVKELAMRRLSCDPCCFVMWDNVGFYMVVVTVDDTIDIATSDALREKVHKALVEKFSWKNCGECDWHLGMRIRQTPHEITIDQTAFLESVFEKFRDIMADVKLHDTPLPEGLKLYECPEGAEIVDFPYESILGCLIWLLKTRIDMVYHVSQLARFMKRHSKDHITAVLHVLGYLKKNPNWGIGFTKNKSGNPGPFLFAMACDSSWADILDGPLKRHSSYCFQAFANGNCFLSVSRITPDICVSCTEAECYAFLCLCKQGRYFICFFMEAGFPYFTPVIGFLDSKTGKNILESWSVSSRTKHWSVMNEFSRSMVIDKGLVGIVLVKSNDNTADLGTKSNGRVLFQQHRDRTMFRVPLNKGDK
jgi:hypothetical protein